MCARPDCPDRESGLFYCLYYDPDKLRRQSVSDSEFQWTIIILLLAIFAALIGAARGLDASLKALFKKLDAILERMT